MEEGGGRWDGGGGRWPKLIGVEQSSRDGFVFILFLPVIIRIPAAGRRRHLLVDHSGLDA